MTPPCVCRSSAFALFKSSCQCACRIRGQFRVRLTGVHCLGVRLRQVRQVRQACMSLANILARQRLASALRHRCTSVSRQHYFPQPCFRSPQRHAPPSAAACGRRLCSNYSGHESHRSTDAEHWLGRALSPDRHRQQRTTVRAAAAARDKLLKGAGLHYASPWCYSDRRPTCRQL